MDEEKKERRGADKKRRLQRFRQWLDQLPSGRTLGRRAVLGLAYAVGALPIHLLSHWLTSR